MDAREDIIRSLKLQSRAARHEMPDKLAEYLDAFDPPLAYHEGLKRARRLFVAEAVLARMCKEWEDWPDTSNWCTPLRRRLLVSVRNRLIDYLKHQKRLNYKTIAGFLMMMAMEGE